MISTTITKQFFCLSHHNSARLWKTNQLFVGKAQQFLKRFSWKRCGYTNWVLDIELLNQQGPYRLVGPYRNPILPAAVAGRILEVPLHHRVSVLIVSDECGDPPLGSYVPNFRESAGPITESTLKFAHC